MTFDHPALILGGTDTRNGAERLADRIRCVLETQPGSLPFAPKFGCDLTGLVGGSATQTRLSEARMRVLAALSKWLPDAEIVKVEVDLVEGERATRARSVPLAEAALASHLVSQALEIRIVVETPDGQVHFDATLETNG